MSGIPESLSGEGSAKQHGGHNNGHWTTAVYNHLHQYHTAAEFDHLLDLIRYFASCVPLDENLLMSCDRLIDVVAVSVCPQGKAFLSRHSYPCNSNLTSSGSSIMLPRAENIGTVEKQIIVPLLSAIHWKRRTTSMRPNANSHLQQPSLTPATTQSREASNIQEFQLPFILSSPAIGLIYERWLAVPLRNDDSLVGKFVAVTAALANLLPIVTASSSSSSPSVSSHGFSRKHRKARYNTDDNSDYNDDSDDDDNDDAAISKKKLQRRRQCSRCKGNTTTATGKQPKSVTVGLVLNNKDNCRRPASDGGSNSHNTSDDERQKNSVLVKSDTISVTIPKSLAPEKLHTHSVPEITGSTRHPTDLTIRTSASETDKPYNTRAAVQKRVPLKAAARRRLLWLRRFHNNSLYSNRVFNNQRKLNNNNSRPSRGAFAESNESDNSAKNGSTVSQLLSSPRSRQQSSEPEALSATAEVSHRPVLPNEPVNAVLARGLEATASPTNASTTMDDNQFWDLGPKLTTVSVQPTIKPPEVVVTERDLEPHAGSTIPLAGTLSQSSALTATVKPPAQPSTFSSDKALEVDQDATSTRSSEGPLVDGQQRQLNVLHQELNLPEHDSRDLLHFWNSTVVNIIDELWSYNRQHYEDCRKYSENLDIELHESYTFIQGVDLVFKTLQTFFNESSTGTLGDLLFLLNNLSRIATRLRLFLESDNKKQHFEANKVVLQNSQLEDDIWEQKLALDTLKRQIIKLEIERDAIEGNLRQVTTTNSETISQLRQDLGTTRHDSQTTSDSLRSRIGALEHEVISLKSDLFQKNSLISHLKSQIDINNVTGEVIASTTASNLDDKMVSLRTTYENNASSFMKKHNLNLAQETEKSVALHRELIDMKHVNEKLVLKNLSTEHERDELTRKLNESVAETELKLKTIKTELQGQLDQLQSDNEQRADENKAIVERLEDKLKQEIMKSENLSKKMLEASDAAAKNWEQSEKNAKQIQSLITPTTLLQDSTPYTVVKAISYDSKARSNKRSRLADDSVDSDSDEETTHARGGPKWQLQQTRKPRVQDSRKSGNDKRDELARKKLSNPQQLLGASPKPTRPSHRNLSYTPIFTSVPIRPTSSASRKVARILPSQPERGPRLKPRRNMRRRNGREVTVPVLKPIADTDTPAHTTEKVSGDGEEHGDDYHDSMDDMDNITKDNENINDNVNDMDQQEYRKDAQLQNQQQPQLPHQRQHSKVYSTAPASDKYDMATDSHGDFDGTLVGATGGEGENMGYTTTQDHGIGDPFVPDINTKTVSHDHQAIYNDASDDLYTVMGPEHNN